MRKHNIFTLGIILTAIYGINAMAAWPTTAATNIWTDSGHTTLADLRCGDCCNNDCWLPSGTYYDAFGTFTESCSGEPSEPTCTPNRTYSMVNGVCKLDKLSCPSGQYDIGLSSCLGSDMFTTLLAYWDFGGSEPTFSPALPDLPIVLTGPGQWGERCLSRSSSDVLTVDITGIASCNNTSGTSGDVTDEEFNNTADGQYCWCKMTYPAASRWVFRNDNKNADNCVRLCASACATDICRNSSPYRSSFFGSVE